MTLREVMDRLKSMGTAQNRKVYARHGVKGEQYGVSYANLKKLKKAIRTNQKLAVELWNTANHDARILATMIADPRDFDDGMLDDWAKDLDNYVVTDAFAGMAGRTPHRKKKAEKWAHSEHEFTGQAGWNLLSQLAMHDLELPPEYFDRYLEHIERDIHKRPNRVRHSMNGALINIGLRTKALEKKAVAAAKRIGRVYVDHGETSCTTPDAIDYMSRTKEFRARQKARAAAKKTEAKTKAKSKTKKAATKRKTKAKSKAKKATTKRRTKAKPKAKKAATKRRTKAKSKAKKATTKRKTKAKPKAKKPKARTKKASSRRSRG